MSPTMESKNVEKAAVTIYRQQWPPPNVPDNAPKRCVDSSKALAGNLWKGGKLFNCKTNLASARQKLRTHRVEAASNVIQRPASCARHERPTSAVTSNEKRQIDDNLRKVEFVTMLSNKNFLRKMYRDKYWTKDNAEKDCNKQSNRPLSPSKVTIGYSDVELFKYYPDMGSVISRPSSRKCVLSSTSTPIYPREGWKMLNKNVVRSTSEDESSITESFKTKESKMNVDIDGSSKHTDKKNGGFLYTAKSSWSNIPMGKNYRMQKHNTDTLKSISLEGRATVHQPRSMPSRSSSSFNSYTNGVQHTNRLSSAGESVSSSRSVDSETSKEDFIVFTTNNKDVSKSADEEVYFDDEEYEHTKLLIDPSICEVKICKSFNEAEEEEEDKSRHERRESIASVTSGGEEYFDSDDESDISECEMNEDSENEVLNQEEGKRRLEQVSAVFSTQSGTSAEEINRDKGDVDENIINEQLSELSFDEFDQVENNVTFDEYQFAEVLCPPFDTCELTTLANLPQDVDWRTCVDLPKYLKNLKAAYERKLSKYNRAGSGKCRKHKYTGRASWEAVMKRYKDAESFMDRLINLERIQSLTVQYEKERKRHLMHVQRARSRAQRQRRPSTANNENTNGKTSPTKQVTVQQELGRLMKTSTPTNDVKPDEAKSRPPTRAQTPRRFTNYKRPWQPRSYDYNCSERIKDFKSGQLTRSLSYSKTRTCSSCRERAKKIISQTSTLNMVYNRSSSVSDNINGSQINSSRTIKLNLSSSKPKQTWVDESVHGIFSSYKTEEQKVDRQVYNYGHATLKPPDVFHINAISSANSLVNSIGKDYSKLDRRNRKKITPFSQRARTTSYGSRQRKRTGKREEYYTSYSDIKLDFS